MEEDAEEAEAEAEEQEQELTLADVVSEAEAAATEAQGVVERPVEPVAQREARWDCEGALGVDGQRAELAFSDFHDDTIRREFGT